MANNIIIVQNIKIMKIFFPSYNIILRDYDYVSIFSFEIFPTIPPPP